MTLSKDFKFYEKKNTLEDKEMRKPIKPYDPEIWLREDPPFFLIFYSKNN